MTQHASANARLRPRILGLILVATMGCNSASTTTESRDDSSEAAKPRIALIMKSLANEFFATMADGAKQHQREHAGDYDLIVNGIKDERDLAQQVSLVEQMIATNVDAIVIAPADSKALIPVCRRAVEAGIVVVNIDNKLDADVLVDTNLKIPFVGPDNRAGAHMVGKFLADRLQAGAEVAILEGIPTAFNAQQRRAGFEQAMRDAGINIVAVQSAQWEMAIANNVAAAILSEHPNLSGLLCSNDNMALGALAAVKSAGRASELAIVGFDNISAVQAAIREGSILATADQHADQLAVFGIEYALQIISGTASPEDRETPVDLITVESLR